MGVQAGAIDAQAVAGLKEAPALHTLILDLWGNNLGYSGVQALASLKEAPALHTLTLDVDLGATPWEPIVHRPLQVSRKHVHCTLWLWILVATQFLPTLETSTQQELCSLFLVPLWGP